MGKHEESLNHQKCQNGCPIWSNGESSWSCCPGPAGAQSSYMKSDSILSRRCWFNGGWFCGPPLALNAIKPSKLGGAGIATSSHSHPSSARTLPEKILELESRLIVGGNGYPTGSSGQLSTSKLVSGNVTLVDGPRYRSAMHGIPNWATGQPSKTVDVAHLKEACSQGTASACLGDSSKWHMAAP